MYSYKVGCVVPMVIRSEFRMGLYRDDDHREHAPHFIFGHNPQFLVKFRRKSWKWLNTCLASKLKFYDWLIYLIIKNVWVWHYSCLWKSLVIDFIAFPYGRWTHHALFFDHCQHRLSELIEVQPAVRLKIVLKEDNLWYLHQTDRERSWDWENF